MHAIFSQISCEPVERLHVAFKRLHMAFKRLFRRASKRALQKGFARPWLI